ncbi:MAG: hypothetical protein RR555_10440, partial [Bacteroidales bacterium]
MQSQSDSTVACAKGIIKYVKKRPVPDLRSSISNVEHYYYLCRMIIDYTTCNIEGLCVHWVGNKQEGELHLT